MLPQQIALLCFLDLHIDTAGGGNPPYFCGTFKAVLQHQKSGSQTVFFVAKLEVYMMKAEEKAKK